MLKFRNYLICCVCLIAISTAQTKPIDQGNVESDEIIKCLERSFSLYRLHKEGRLDELADQGVFQQSYQTNQLQVLFPAYRNGNLQALLNENELSAFYFSYFNEQEYNAAAFASMLENGDFQLIREIEKNGDLATLEQLAGAIPFSPSFVSQTFNIFCLFQTQWQAVNQQQYAQLLKQGEFEIHQTNVNSNYYDQIFSEAALLDYYDLVEQKLALPEALPEQISQIPKSKSLFELHEQGKLNQLYKILANGELSQLMAISEQIPCKTITLTHNEDCQDQDYNWTIIQTFDGNDNLVGSAKEYSDLLGNSFHVQSTNLEAENILAMQTIFDAWGRGVLATLPAPINKPDFCLDEAFVQNQQGEPYAYDDFDQPNTSNRLSGEVDRPQPVYDQEPGTLGWYYSNHNNLEPYVPSSSFPYSRVEYFRNPKGPIKRVSGTGEKLAMGSGKEVKLYPMPASGELHYVFGIQNFCQIQYHNHQGQVSNCNETNRQAGYQVVKNIVVDENGNESIQFNDFHGNVIATCLSGQVDQANRQTQLVSSVAAAGTYIDIHLPEGTENTVSTNHNLIYDIIDLSTEDYVCRSCNNPVLTPGYYRFINHSGYQNLIIDYELNYYNFSLYYYDKADRLVQIIPPKGVDKSYPPDDIELFEYDARKWIPGFRYNATDDLFNPEFKRNIPTTPADKKQFTNLLIALDEYDPALDGIIVPNLSDHSFPVTATKTNGKVLRHFPSSFTASNSISHQIGGAFLNSSTGTGNQATRRSIHNNIDHLPEQDQLQKKLPSKENGNDLEGSQGKKPDDPIGNYHTRVRYIFYIDIYAKDGGTNSELLRSGSLYAEKAPSRFNINTGLLDPEYWIFSNGIETFINETQSQWAGEVSVVLKKVVKQLYWVSWSTNDHILQGGPVELRDLTELKELVMTIHADRYILPGSEPQHSMASTYQYNAMNWLLWEETPDAGMKAFVYRQDGQLRFSQNAEQRQTGKFSYINYDRSGRVIETGEYDPTINSTIAYPLYFSLKAPGVGDPLPANNISIHHILEQSDGLDNDRCTQQVFYSYDLPQFPGTGLPGYQQQYLLGKLSKIQNDNGTIWFSYDELGRTTWMIQDIREIGLKTIDYTYDFLGNITQIAFQQDNLNERFYHHFTYDKDKRLIEVITNTANNAECAVKQATYHYYLHGPLKRLLVGDDLQGIDYVYNINGWLKSINNPRFGRDPGKDGQNGVHAGVAKDVFALTLDYYTNDYIRDETGIQSWEGHTCPIDNFVLSSTGTGSGGDPNLSLPDHIHIPTDETTGAEALPVDFRSRELYNGMIKAMRWQTRTSAAAGGNADLQDRWMYAFLYDRQYQLNAAIFGRAKGGYKNLDHSQIIRSVNDYTDLYFTPRPNFTVMNITHDENGNLLSLNRKGNQNYGLANKNSCPLDLNNFAGLYDMDNFHYHYHANNNQLAYVSDQVPNNHYTHDLDNQAPGNLIYNASGQLINDLSQNAYLKYDVYGKLIETGIYMSLTLPGVGVVQQEAPKVRYHYDAAGFRVKKTLYTPTPLTPADNSHIISETWYVRDAGGNIMSIYENKSGGANPNIFQSELPVYGQDRIGVNYFTPVGNPNSFCTTSGGAILPYRTPELTLYELKDHLGHVRATIRGEKDANGDAQMLSYTDYYPFGSYMPGRRLVSSNLYRFGFQGQFAEQDEETGWNSFTLRMWHSDLGRWFQPDPYGQYHSPYLGMGNNPISFLDPDGGKDYLVINGVRMSTTSVPVITETRSYRVGNHVSFAMMRAHRNLIASGRPWEHIRWGPEPGPENSGYDRLGDYVGLLLGGTVIAAVAPEVLLADALPSGAAIQAGVAELVTTTELASINVLTKSSILYQRLFAAAGTGYLTLRNSLNPLQYRWFRKNLFNVFPSELGKGYMFFNRIIYHSNHIRYHGPHRQLDIRWGNRWFKYRWRR